MLGNSLIARLGEVNASNFAQFQVPLSGDLATITGAWVGAWAYVDSQRVGYMAVPVGRGDVAGLGVDWKRDIATSDPGWRSQATWFVDIAAGSEDASGIDVAHPVRTTDEIQARWGTNPRIGVTVTITLAAGVYGTTYLRATPFNNAFLIVQGTATTLASGPLDAVGGYVKYTHGVYPGTPPEGTIVKSAALVDFTPYLRKRLRSGAAGDLLSWVAKVNPAGGGISTARTSPFGKQTLGTNTWTQLDPVNGQTLFIEEIPTLDSLWIEWVGDADDSHPAVQVRHLRINKVLHVVGEATPRSVYGCDFPKDSSIDSWTACSFFYFITCQQVGNFGAAGRHAASHFWGAYSVITGNGLKFAQCLFLSCTFQSIASHSVSVNGSGQALLQDCQLFDGASDLISVQGRGTSIELTNVSGTGQVGPAVVLGDNCQIITSGIINLLAPSSVEISINGFTGAYGAGGLHWSDLPAGGWQIGKWSGTGVLTAGVLSVALAPALTNLFVAGSPISSGYIVPKTIAAPQLGQNTISTAGFHLFNGDVADNTSTVWWQAASLTPRTDKIMPASKT